MFILTSAIVQEIRVISKYVGTLFSCPFSCKLLDKLNQVKISIPEKNAGRKTSNNSKDRFKSFVSPTRE